MEGVNSMTLLDIAIHLRRMGAELASEPNWNPKNAFLVRLDPIETWTPACEGVGELLLAAYRSGVFGDAYFSALRPRMIGATQYAIVMFAEHWLTDKAFSVADDDPQL